jgi:ABC-type multidrug transport system fused ATPase/permease subunit
MSRHRPIREIFEHRTAELWSLIVPAVRHEPINQAQISGEPVLTFGPKGHGTADFWALTRRYCVMLGAVHLERLRRLTEHLSGEAGRAISEMEALKRWRAAKIGERRMALSHVALSSVAADNRALNAAHLRLDAAVKSFDAVTAVDHVTLEIPPGAFATVLGPSGCGKTTLLRMIAGFYEPNGGAIYLDNVRIDRLPARKLRVQ